MSKVNAQKARRVLDRIVGYYLSPLLWKKVKNGLSAGRVQSVALRLICEREAEIEAFLPEEYWSLEAELRKGKSHFVAQLVAIDGEKPVLSDGSGDPDMHRRAFGRAVHRGRPEGHRRRSRVPGLPSRRPRFSRRRQTGSASPRARPCRSPRASTRA